MLQFNLYIDLFIYLVALNLNFKHCKNNLSEKITLHVGMPRGKLYIKTDYYTSE